MGGFAFDMQDLPEHQKFLPESLDRMALGPHALYGVAIAAPELFPRLRPEEIQDKSKANGISKTIALPTSHLVHSAVHLPPRSGF